MKRLVTVALIAFTAIAGCTPWYAKYNIASEAALTQPSSIPQLTEAVRKTSPSGDAYQAVLALEQIGKPAIPALATALNHESSWVVQNAIRALGRMKAEEAVPTLAACLRDPEATVRAAAAAALGDIQSPAAVAALVAALGDKEGDVVEAAATALGVIGSAHPEVVTDNLLKALQEAADEGPSRNARGTAWTARHALVFGQLAQASASSSGAPLPSPATSAAPK
jgi:HEAT repeat protein